MGSDMQRCVSVITAVLLVLAALGSAEAGAGSERTFSARGVILEIKSDTGQLVIRHKAIAGYMGAMTMPFKVKDSAAFTELKRGDQVTFQLHVTADESWVDHVQKVGTVSLPENKAKPVATVTPRPDKS